MGNLISNSSNNRFIIYCTLGAFAFTTIAPLHAMPVAKSGANVNLNDINFGIRMEKLIGNVKKYFKAKESKKLMAAMFDIKHEIEGYTGQRIDIDKHLDQVEKEAKSKGMPIDKMHMKEMRKRFKKQEKRSSHKALYMASCLEYDISFNAEEEEVFYQASIADHYGMAKSSKGKDKDEEVVLPLRITIGVTMSLVGLFLYVVPFPICKAAAPWVLDAGIAFLLDQSITEWEESQKKD
jgi:hypothetical protein